MFKTKAFTLLEMLVVIGIIAIMLGIGATSYSSAQKRARDARRRSDLKSIQACLEQNYLKNKSYLLSPALAPGPLPASISCGDTNMDVKDPINSTTYRYSFAAGSDSTNYTVTATLESDSSTISVVSQQ